MEEIKGKINGKLYCSNCNLKTNHGYLLKHQITHMDYLKSPEDDVDLQFDDDYYITQCLGCDKVAFFHEYGDEDMMNRLGETYTEKNVYPEEPRDLIVENHRHIYDVRYFDNVPDIIQELYIQVVSCFEKNHSLLAAVGLRMIIEGFCNDRQISNGYILDDNNNKATKKNGDEIRSSSLEGRINGMEEERLITPVSASVLHQIRNLGNTTVHELEIPKQGTIKQGLGIVEDLIKTVYEHENIKI